MKLLIHKLAYDALFLTLIACSALVVSDVLFPGFLTRFISLSSTFIVLSITLLIIVCTYPHNDAKTKKLPYRKRVLSVRAYRFLVLLSCFLILMITALTLRSFALWEACTILILLAALLAFAVHTYPMKSA